MSAICECGLLGCQTCGVNWCAFSNGGKWYLARRRGGVTEYLMDKAGKRYRRFESKGGALRVARQLERK